MVIPINTPSTMPYAVTTSCFMARTLAGQIDEMVAHEKHCGAWPFPCPRLSKRHTVQFREDKGLLQQRGISFAGF